MTAGFERMHRAARRAVVLSAMVAVASACQ
jgi:hypothetical protein